MVGADLLDNNQHKYKWCCKAETLAYFHICIIHSYIDNISPHFAWYKEKPSTHELKTFGFDIYLITSSTKHFYYRKQ